MAKPRRTPTPKKPGPAQKPGPAKPRRRLRRPSMPLLALGALCAFVVLVVVLAGVGQKREEGEVARVLADMATSQPTPPPAPGASRPVVDAPGGPTLPGAAPAVPPIEALAAQAPAAQAPAQLPERELPKGPPPPSEGAKAAALAAPPKPWAKPTAPRRDGERPRIVIVIDDMGVDRKRSDRVVAMPGPLTLAWLPYARDLPQQTAAARARGHELIVHVPMQPDGDADPGPNALLTGMGEGEIRRRLAANLSAFDGYVGINNHMGSRFTADAGGMAVVLGELSSRGLLFLDSRTTQATAAPEVARRIGLPTAGRDVFLDHEQTPAFLKSALAKTEAIAQRDGLAIAIGHPHDVTIKALSAWLPTLAAKGFDLVPLSAVAKPLAPS